VSVAGLVSALFCDLSVQVASKGISLNMNSKIIKYLVVLKQSLENNQIQLLHAMDTVIGFGSQTVETPRNVESPVESISPANIPEFQQNSSSKKLLSHFIVMLQFTFKTTPGKITLTRLEPENPAEDNRRRARVPQIGDDVSEIASTTLPSITLSCVVNSLPVSSPSEQDLSPAPKELWETQANVMLGLGDFELVLTPLLTTFFFEIIDQFVSPSSSSFSSMREDEPPVTPRRAMAEKPPAFPPAPRTSLKIVTRVMVNVETSMSCSIQVRWAMNDANFKLPHGEHLQQLFGIIPYQQTRRRTCQPALL